MFAQALTFISFVDQLIFTTASYKESPHTYLIMLMLEPFSDKEVSTGWHTKSLEKT